LTWNIEGGPVSVAIATMAKPKFFQVKNIFYSLAPNAIVISTDTLNWNTTFNGYNQDFGVTSVYPSASGQSLVLSADGNVKPNAIFTSTDGISWQKVSMASGSPRIQNIFPVSDELYFGFQGAFNAIMYYSTDSGVNWTKMNVTLSTLGVPNFAYWLSNGDNICLIGENIVCAKNDSMITQSNSWTRVDPYQSEDVSMSLQPIVVNGTFVLIFANDKEHITLTSTTGLTWVQNSMANVYDISGFDSNQDDLILGVGYNGYVTSTKLIY